MVTESVTLLKWNFVKKIGKLKKTVLILKVFIFFFPICSYMIWSLLYCLKPFKPDALYFFFIIILSNWRRNIHFWLTYINFWCSQKYALTSNIKIQSIILHRMQLSTPGLDLQHQSQRLEMIFEWWYLKYHF